MKRSVLWVFRGWIFCGKKKKMWLFGVVWLLVERIRRIIGVCFSVIDLWL